MSNGNINIYGSRITNGVWQIMSDGGWVNAALLVGPKRATAERYVWTMPDEYAVRHAAGRAYTFDPSKSSDDRPELPKGKGKGVSGRNGDGDGESQDSQGSQDGDGEDQDGEGSGSGSGEDDGDDAPVWHSEFDPWQERIHADLKKLETSSADALRISSENAISVGILSESVDKQNKVTTRLSAEMAELKAKGGGNGAAITIRVEIKMPNIDWQGTDGVFHHQFDKLLKNIAGGHHSYLPGPPGSGKSHAAKQAADVLGWRFGSLSLGPTTPESRLWGGRDANNNFHEPPLVKLARFAMANPDSGACYCLDELDNGHPGIIATLNSAMANGWFEAPNGDLIEWGKNFVIVGSANTYGTGPTAEFSGRNRLDAATLDRFNFLPWETDFGMENLMVRSILAHDDSLCADWMDVWASIRRNVESAGVKVFVTMRGAIRGATMIAQGRDIYDTAGEVLLNKLPDDVRAKVSPF